MTLRNGVLAMATVVAAPACVDHVPGLDGTQSLRVEILTPTDLGSEANRLPDTVTSVDVRVTAIGADGEIDGGFGYPVQVYAQFLSSLTPSRDGLVPPTTIQLAGGVSPVTTIDLPPVYGPTYLWIEDGDGEEASFATGTSSTLWFRDAFVADIQRPSDENAVNALVDSPLEGKQAVVSQSRYGARGRLIVTSTYAQGFTVSDVECADANGTPPCVAGDYDHMLVFSFSRPRDEEGQSIVDGQVISGFNGAVQEFNGLTEIGFPQAFVEDPDVNLARMPAPRLVQPSWLTDDKIEFERVESGLVEIQNATVCALDDEFETFKQWKLDLGLGCGEPVNVITAGTITDFDPATVVGMTLPSVVGTLRPVNIGSFNVWIVFPRSSADLQLP